MVMKALPSYLPDIGRQRAQSMVSLLLAALLRRGLSSASSVLYRPCRNIPITFLGRLHFFLGYFDLELLLIGQILQRQLSAVLNEQDDLLDYCVIGEFAGAICQKLARGRAKLLRQLDDSFFDLRSRES